MSRHQKQNLTKKSAIKLLNDFMGQGWGCHIGSLVRNYCAFCQVNCKNAEKSNFGMDCAVNLLKKNDQIWFDQKQSFWLEKYK